MITKKESITSNKLIAGRVLKRESVSDDPEIYSIEDLVSHPEIVFKYCYSIQLDQVELVDLGATSNPTSIFVIKQHNVDKIVAVFSCSDIHFKYSLLHYIDESIWYRLKLIRSHYMVEELPKYKSDITMNGLLCKQGRQGVWRQEYCELAAIKFSWCKDINKEKSVNSVFIGNLNILLCTTDKPYSFKIDNGKTVHTFAVDSPHSRMQWVNSFRNSIRAYLTVLKERPTTPLASPRAVVIQSAPNSPEKKSPLRLSIVKSSKTDSTQITKQGILYKENKNNKFIKYNGTLETKTLTLIKEKKKPIKISLDMIIHKISSDNITEIRHNDATLFSITLSTETSIYTIATKDRSELQSWIYHFTLLTPNSLSKKSKQNS